MAGYGQPPTYVPTFGSGAGVPGMMDPSMPRAELGVGHAADIDQYKAKHSTVYVGNITDIFPDNLVRDLLARCGKVLKWNRISAESDGRLPPFGFCTFANQDETLRCIRLLSNKEFGEKALVIKVDDATRKYLDEYIKDKKSFRDDVDDEALDESARAEDQRRGAQIDALLTKLNSEYSESIARLKASGGGHSASLANIRGRDLRKNDEGLEEADDSIASEVQRFRQEVEKSESKRMEQEHKRVLSRREAFDRKNDSRDQDNFIRRDDETPMAAALRRAEEYKMKLISRDKGRRLDFFRDRERQVLKREKQMRRDEQRFQEREEQRLEDIKRRAERQLQFERTYYDEKDDERYFRSSMIAKLKEDAARERELDDKDRDAEREEAEAEARRLQEEAEAAKRAEEEAEEEARRQALAEEEAQREKQAAEAAAAAAQESREEEQKQLELQKAQAEQDPKSQPSALGDIGASGFGIKLETKAAPAKRALSSKAELFQDPDDDEELLERKKSKIIPLTYTAEQMRNAGLDADEERQRRRKEIVSSIPTSKDELFAYAIDWSMATDDVIKERIQPWISMKLAEFVGDDAKDLAEFVADKVASHTQAAEILEDLAQIFEEEAEIFVIKLWRLIIFETQARKFGVN